MKPLPRILTFALLAFFVAHAQGQDLEQRITHSSVAKRADVLAAELTQKTGVPIRVDREVAGEVVAVHVRDVPLVDLLRRIAEVTSSELARDAQGNLVLRLNREDARRQEREALAKRAETVRAALQGWQTRLEAQSAAEAQGQTRAEQRRVVAGGPTGGMFVNESSPIGRAIMRMAMLVRPEDLAAVGPGQRVVFSTNPTRMQTALGRRTDRILADLVREQQASYQAWQRNQATRPRTPEQEQAIQIARQMGFQLEPHPMNTPVAKALLVVSSGQIVPMIGGESLQVELRLYDANGAVMVNGQTTLGASPLEALTAQLMGQTTPPAGPASPDAARPIALTPLANAARAFAGTASAATAVRPSDELLEALRRPDLVDPHSLVTSEATIALATSRGENLVANFPDTFVAVTPMSGIRVAVGGDGAPTVETGAASDLTLGGWDRTLSTSQELSIQREAGWMVVKPSDPVEARERRVDRQALARLIRAVDANGAPALVDTAEYAAANHPPTIGSVELPYISYWAPGLMTSVRGPVNWNLLRLYGHLSESQRRALLNGGRLSLAALTGGARQVLEQMLFGTDARFEPLAGGRGGPGDLGTMISRFMPPQQRSLRDEPTELMPNGVPRDGILFVNVSQTQFLRPLAPDGSPMWQLGLLGPEEYAMMESFRRMINDPQVQAQFPTLNQARVGVRQTLDFNIVVAPDSVLRGTLNNDSMPRDARTVTMDNLPAEFAAQAQRYREVYDRLGGQLGVLNQMGRRGQGPQAP